MADFCGSWALSFACPNEHRNELYDIIVLAIHRSFVTLTRQRETHFCWAPTRLATVRRPRALLTEPGLGPPLRRRAMSGPGHSPLAKVLAHRLSLRFTCLFMSAVLMYVSG